jgi:hypothetical protein
MVSKTYSVSLDQEVVIKALKYANPYGGRLSPLLNEFLKRFIESEEGDNYEKRK